MDSVLTGMREKGLLDEATASIARSLMGEGKPLEDAVVKQAIADAEAELAKSGRLVIRPSGTEPLIRVMAEGDDREQVERIVNELVDVIGSVRSAAA